MFTTALTHSAHTYYVSIGLFYILLTHLFLHFEALETPTPILAHRHTSPAILLWTACSCEIPFLVVCTIVRVQQTDNWNQTKKSTEKFSFICQSVLFRFCHCVAPANSQLNTGTHRAYIDSVCNVMSNIVMSTSAIATNEMK